jgi:hypothetical protein
LPQQISTFLNVFNQSLTNKVTILMFEAIELQQLVSMLVDEDGYKSIDCLRRRDQMAGG